MVTPDKPPSKNHIKTAIALEYNPKDDEAPRVIASGRGEIADRILKLAQENQIPIREDPILAQALSLVDLEEEIPSELYAVVAEVLGWVYRLREKTIKE
jgi:flagellar biosynthesis protein